MKEFNQSYIGLREDLIKFVEGSENTILDVGCATGTTGKYLLDQKIASIVYGVEYDKQMIKNVEEVYTKAYFGDLNDSAFRKEILACGIKFDYIIFGDILEHLYFPEIVLGDLKDLLKDNGTIIISLPNVGHIELFIQVYLKGRWPRNKRGIFDNTHLRWFTKKDAFDLVIQNGLKVVNYKPNLRARDTVNSRWDLKYKLVKFFNKNLVIFQHILICRNG